MTPKRLLVRLPCAALLAACTTDDAPPLDTTPTTPAISTTPLTSTPAAIPAVPAAPDTEEADSNGEDWMVGALRDFERQNSGQSFPTEVVPYYEGDPLNEARADLAIRNCDQYMRSFHDSYRLTPQYDVPGDPSSIRQPEIISLVHHQDQRIELIVRAYMMSGDRPVETSSSCMATPTNYEATEYFVQHTGSL